MGVLFGFQTYQQSPVQLYLASGVPCLTHQGVDSIGDIDRPQNWTNQSWLPGLKKLLLATPLAGTCYLR